MEALALITAAKQFGLDVQILVPMAIVYFLLNRSFAKQFAKLIDAINRLEKSHNERISRIEDHVGLTKEKT